MSTFALNRQMLGRAFDIDRDALATSCAVSRHASNGQHASNRPRGTLHEDTHHRVARIRYPSMCALRDFVHAGTIDGADRPPTRQTEELAPMRPVSALAFVSSKAEIPA